MNLGARWADVLDAARPAAQGRLSGVVGLSLHADGVSAAIGDIVRVETPGLPVLAEVVAVREAGLACMPLGEITGVRAGALVTPTGGPMVIPVGGSLLGRVLDGLGRPMDDKGPLDDVESVTVEGNSPHPLRRARIDEQLSLGVRALDALVPCGRGQRLGV
ncbi:MAG TPA: EscN/YscN/HrcN family type III secretion system ATPase, partial [Acidothermaceae bacterium]